MSGGRTTILRDKLRKLGTTGQATLISAVIALCWLAAAPLAYEVSGPRGPLAAGVAATICLVGSLAALVMVSLVRGSAATMYALAFGMLARTMVPLIVGVVLTMKVEWLADAGMIFYLLVFYLASLAVETTLLVAQVSTPVKS